MLAFSQTFIHVLNLTYFPKSDIFIYICLVLITLFVNRLTITVYLVELVDPRKLNVALKWLWLWVTITLTSDLLSDFDFDQIPSREQITVQNCSILSQQFCSALESSTQLVSGSYGFESCLNLNLFRPCFFNFNNCSSPTNNFYLLE